MRYGDPTGCIRDDIAFGNTGEGKPVKRPSSAVTHYTPIDYAPAASTVTHYTPIDYAPAASTVTHYTPIDYAPKPPAKKKLSSGVVRYGLGQYDSAGGMVDEYLQNDIVTKITQNPPVPASNIWEDSFRSENSGDFFADVFYGYVSLFNIKNGIELIDAGAGLVNVEYDGRIFGASLEALTGDFQVGATTEGVGVNIGARLLAGGFTVRIPISEEEYLYWGVEGEFGGIGVSWGYHDGGFRYGASALYGGYVIGGIGRYR